MEKNELVKVSHLVKNFLVQSSMWSKGKEEVHAVSDVSFSVYRGETLGLVGESGCGKSTLGRLLLNLVEPTSGEIIFDDMNIHKIPASQLQHLRRNMQIVFQDPYASLNPRWKIRDIIAEPMETHKFLKSKEEITQRVKELMVTTGIRSEFIDRYPHQFSGGQRQRVGIARALALNPKFIVCDEPVSALDVSIQSQILNLLSDIQEKTGVTYLFISHDLSVIRHISDRVCVMFLGKICEIGSTELVYSNSLHPYTKFLIEAVPKPDPFSRKEQKKVLLGEIPSPVNPPSGCRFRTRCPWAVERCKEEEPILREIDGRAVACHRVEELS